MTPVFKEGDSFRGYVIERRLGSGGLGSVWLARHEVLDSLFAVKVLDRDIARSKPEYVKRFVREAKLATKIRHPNLVSVHDAGYDDARDVYYLVMDYVEGDTLRMAITLGGPRPPAEAADVVLQIAGVLEAAQHFGLVHRDLKPENVMLSSGGGVKLLDLGVAKVANRIDSLRTMPRSVFGTPSYIAPEQAVDASRVDPRADVYSLGVILFELLAGRRPYDVETPVEELRRLLSPDPLPDVREFAPSVPPALAALVAKMCAKRPEDRFASPRELIDAFRAAGYEAAPASSAAADEASPVPSIGQLVASAGMRNRRTAISDITLDTTDPDVSRFLVSRRRSRRLCLLLRVATAAAVFALILFAALKASAAVQVADCERDPEKDVWAAADVDFARAVMDDVFRAAGVETERLPFKGDALADFDRAEVVCSAFRTPSLLERYDFPLQPLGRMHFALYATPARAKKMMSVKITDWPRMRVGYSPVSLGRGDDRVHYFEHATLNPEYVEYPTSAGAVEALQKDEIDVLFLYTPEGKRPAGLVEIVPIGSRNVYFAVRKDRPELLRQLSAAYRECYIDNVERYDVLRERLLGVPKPARRVRIAAYNRGNLFEVTPDGDRSGIIEEWISAICAHAHWTPDYVYGEYGESLGDVAAGRLDLVGGIGFSADRSESFFYPHTPIGMIRVYLWTHPDSSYKAGDPSTWGGMKVGLLSGALSAKRMKQHLENFPCDISCREYATDRELTEAYFSGEIDACVNIEMPALAGERALHVYASHPMYLCATPKKRNLFSELELALDGVCDDFPRYMKMITERHYGTRSEMSMLTLKEADWLRERVKDPSPVMIDFSPWPVNLKDDEGRLTHFVKAFLGELSRTTGLAFDTLPQTGIQTAEAKFLRGETAFWIPYPAKFDVAAAGGVSVFSVPVPQTYAEMVGADDRAEELEMWANRDVPEELVSVLRKAVAAIDPMRIQEMFIQAAAQRAVIHNIFGMTDEEFERMMLVVGFAIVSAIAVFAFVMAMLLRRQVRRANESARLAEEYAKAKTRFLAMMSHELRTPLNAVIGFSEFLARADCDGDRRRDYISGIQLSANALLDLINDILDLSKLDSGAMHMLSGECDVAQIVEELPAIFNYRVRRSGVPLVVRHTSDAPVPVLRLSPQGLKQILINLVGNSAKFTTEGEIAVEYGWDPARAALKLRVSDTGCGISSEKMARLFDPFVQDIASRMKHADGEQRGTGLGLPIVKRMVDGAGGTISVKSEIGKGTTFDIVIPDLAVVRESHHEEVAPTPTIPGRILVVDDMAINRKVLGIHLRNLGVEDVRFAENGIAALDAMKDWRPDAVLTDMWMPEMDGQQLAAAMKINAPLADIPVFAITADIDVASTYDMSDFAKVIAKPVTSDKLRALFA